MTFLLMHWILWKRILRELDCICIGVLEAWIMKFDRTKKDKHGDTESKKSINKKEKYKGMEKNIERKKGA